jgi:hypothetical protein
VSEQPVTLVRVYRDADDEWRWSAQASNGEKVADSGEGYLNKQHAVDMAERLFPDAALRVED